MSSFHEGQLLSPRKLYILVCLVSLGLYWMLGETVLGAIVVEVEGVNIIDRGYCVFKEHMPWDF